MANSFAGPWNYTALNLTLTEITIHLAKWSNKPYLVDFSMAVTLAIHLIGTVWYHCGEIAAKCIPWIKNKDKKCSYTPSVNPERLSLIRSKSHTRNVTIYLYFFLFLFSVCPTLLFTNNVWVYFSVKVLPDHLVSMYILRQKVFLDLVFSSASVSSNRINLCKKVFQIDSILLLQRMLLNRLF